MMMKKWFAVFGFLVLVATLSNAQGVVNNEEKLELKNEIARLDSIVFDAFNKRDTTTFIQYFSKDLEFYHDRGGLTGFDHMVSFIKGLAENENGIKRTLVKDKLEVFPIPGYGAMQMGEHVFCHPENGKTECGTFRFMHIWKRTDAGWKITRVFSYDH